MTSLANWQQLERLLENSGGLGPSLGQKVGVAGRAWESAGQPTGIEPTVAWSQWSSDVGSLITNSYQIAGKNEPRDSLARDNAVRFAAAKKALEQARQRETRPGRIALIDEYLSSSLPTEPTKYPPGGAAEDALRSAISVADEWLRFRQRGR